MVNKALVRALTRVPTFAFAPKTSRMVPMKEVVGERARRSGSGSPFSLLILFQWRRVKQSAMAAEEAVVSRPWRIRTTMRVVPTLDLTHQLSSCCLSDCVWAHVAVKVKSTMTTNSADETATKAVCQRRSPSCIVCSWTAGEWDLALL
jgi:hypothetical protein